MSEYESDYYDEDDEDLVMRLAQFVGRALKRKQAVIGQDRFINLARRKQIGFLWLTEDISKSSFKRIVMDCEKFDIPCIIRGKSDDIALFTRYESTKVYIVKKSMSGLKQFVSELPEDNYCYVG